MPKEKEKKTGYDINIDDMGIPKILNPFFLTITIWDLNGLYDLKRYLNDIACRLSELKPDKYGNIAGALEFVQIMYAKLETEANRQKV